MSIQKKTGWMIMDNLDNNVASLLGKINGEKKKRRSILYDEPRNDIEKVLKRYYLEWQAKYEAGSVKTPRPFLNYARTARQIKQILNCGVDAEQLCEAVSSGFDDEFIAKGGYTLAVILSANVLNKLLNKKEDPVIPKSKDSVSVGWEKY